MPTRTPRRELLFQISDVARLLRTHADQKAALTGMTRAQWAVLLRLERLEGLMQADLAAELDIQPITLTRLVDRLCEAGLVERRPDPNDRRAKRLHLTPAARPLLEQISVHVEELAATVLDGLDADAVRRLLADLGTVRKNLKRAIQTTNTQDKASRYA